MGAGKWIGGILGFMTMGPLGALAGFALGSLLDGNNGLFGNTYEKGQAEAGNYDEGQRNSFLFSMLVMASYIIRADGHEIAPRLILAAVDKEGKVINEGAGAKVDVHAGAELGAHLVGVHALVVGHGAADAVGRELTAEAVRRVALQEHAAAQALVDDGC